MNNNIKGLPNIPGVNFISEVGLKEYVDIVDLLIYMNDTFNNKNKPG